MESAVIEEKNTEKLPFSNNAALLASLVFGPLAGMIIIYQGLKNIWQEKSAKDSLIFGSILLITLFLLVNFTNYFDWSASKWINTLFWGFLYFVFYRKAIIDWKKNNPDKKYESGWKAFWYWLVGMIWMILINLALISLTYTFYSQKIDSILSQKLSWHDIMEQEKLFKSNIDTDKLLSMLWQNEITYPIVGFGGDWAEPTTINSLEDYKNDLLYWKLITWNNRKLWADYIIDALWKKMKATVISAHEVWINNSEMQDFSFEKFENTGEIIPFQSLKDQIVNGIKSTEDSVYSKLLNEINESKNIQELVKVMNKVDE